MKEFFEVHRRLVIFAGVPFVFVLAVCTWLFWWPNPSAGPDGTTVSIPRGASFSVALDSLDAAGAISSRFTLKVAARIFGYDRMVRVGRYHFPPGMSNLAMLEDLASGSSRVLIAVPIPEGWRMEYIAKRFERFLSVDSAKIVSMCRDSGVIRGFGIDAPTLEGYLLPDTYEFYWQTDEDQIIRTMVNAFKAFYVDSLVRRQQELRLTLNETLALAAIVEGESSLDAERSTIAGVYWNRLKKRMRLEADPTVQYVLPDGPRRLLYEDLRFLSPYNTYLHYGLPPGPISNPGRGSILAALYPEDHTYLFFVATGAGGHRFSRTYAEHLQAVRTFRRVRRQMQMQAANQTS
ncbi:MAG: hypothetical protein A3H45_12065 [Ignavibacteria bacterium RIFCSPLOWO2_02_FULL_55_14]|nr:MAG: hypothetical protein A3H45_12065 [Ignavibacteria bacterium RIFCSPLOWO2_02_FULL_55_14]OGU73238.1 MAG: hypothetical protein A3G43_02395 [Ignavibacteria bacterium RIFCSPLOWO2_12_FULL_56_21]HAV23042.1 endolytic transglycosylase MltG [Bacteroidota bacterium]